MGSFWQEDCPERGSALSHAHWNMCSPKGYHPGTNDKHLDDQCCHCGGRSNPQPPVADVKEVLQQPTADHVYRWTMAGKCAECQGIEDAHPLSTSSAHDHDTIKTQLLIGDGGLEWTDCVVCAMFVEPQRATGRPVGKHWGPGRGEMTERLKRKLDFIAVTHGYGSVRP